MTLQTFRLDLATAGIVVALVDPHLRACPFGTECPLGLERDFRQAVGA